MLHGRSASGTRNSKSGARGFSLMEVLVAVSLLGIAYTVIFSLMSTSLRNVRKVEEKEKAVRFGQMKLNELVLRVQRGEEGYPLSGMFDETYGWKAEVLPYIPDAVEEESARVRPITLARIRLSVERKGDAPKELVSFETIGWRTKLP